MWHIIMQIVISVLLLGVEILSKLVYRGRRILVKITGLGGLLGLFFSIHESDTWRRISKDVINYHRFIRITLDESDDYFLSNPGNLHGAPSLSRPICTYPQPARTSAGRRRIEDCIGPVRR